jgi:hypothetical protein
MSRSSKCATVWMRPDCEEWGGGRSRRSSPVEGEVGEGTTGLQDCNREYVSDSWTEHSSKPNKRWRVDIMKRLIMWVSPSFCCFLSLSSLCINNLLRLYLQVHSTYKHHETCLEFIWTRPPPWDVSKQQRDASCHVPTRPLTVGSLCSQAWLRGTCPTRHANVLTLIAVKFDFGRKMKRKTKKICLQLKLSRG